ncbi:LexA family protein [Virgibacillus proomii]|uniref:LexA family protein n=1 Tax=Virgibacillus proomii TaxID=84407 RepID=UPI000987C3DA|nr:XRE family transcriptional regulator [Virgibacillus proomii]
MSSQKEIFAKNLQQLLEARKVDQKDLANYLNTSETSVSNWVKGYKYPRIGNIQKIADYFGVKKSDLIEEKGKNPVFTTTKYPFLPVSVAAGLPEVVDPVTEDNIETISIPDAIMGKWAGSDDIYIMRVNGESMNKIIPNHSLIAVKKIDISNLQNGDIVVYSNHYEYSVKRFYKFDDRLVFKPHSTDVSYSDNNVPFDSYHNIKIHGKVVLYIVNLD